MTLVAAGQAALFDNKPAPARGVPAGHRDDLRWRAVGAWLQYLPGVGPGLADRLRAAGVEDWRAVESGSVPLPARLRPAAAWAARAGRQHLEKGDAAHFLSRLPRSEHWRVAAAFPDQALLLDIETTGLSSHYHRVTCVGWALGDECGAAVLDGEETDLDNGGRELQDALARASVLVTFNGAHFDVPFLRRRLPALVMPPAHVDLRHAGRRASLSGGQKKVEEELGLPRGALAGLTGEDAPALWFRYQRGDLDSLETLLRYNHADVDGLRRILGAVAGRLVPGLPPPNEPGCCPRATSRKAQGRDRGRPARIVAASADAPASLGGPVLRPYRGLIGPRVVLGDVPEALGLRVVGVDLAGSAKGRTGWAFAQGDASWTAALRTDEEILARTLDARPDLVSIDAPLSLPSGRLTVGDDDPGRARFGIMRECERELKRRGVNTYPALIRSMQALTARGIALAAELRSLGVPVIESFPGAMQDILGIPRKGLSLDMLKQAVGEYGLAGPWQDQPATHDEIDALCCAIVGQMFWAGRYEALGTEEEDHLIVPRTERSDGPARVVGLSGRTGAGKSTAARILAERGFVTASFSGVLAVGNPGATREELLRLGEQARQRPGGQRRLGQAVAAAVSDAPLGAVDGLRFPEDDALMRERFGPAFVHVHVEAPQDARRERFLGRGGAPHEYVTVSAGSAETGSDAMRALADHVVENTGTVDEFERALLAALDPAARTA